MGQKISPTALRITVTKDWKSRWFSMRNYKAFLKEDLALREFLKKRLKSMSVDRIIIERSPDIMAITVHTARPGLIIGRAGTGVEDLKKALRRMIKRKTTVRLDIQEIKNPEASAAIMAESMVEQVEKRIQYRRILKQSLSKIPEAQDLPSKMLCNCAY